METKRHFFILGLPRSRTAWLSVLLTGHSCFCFHEGTGSFPTWEAYVAGLKARPEPCVGDSNPAMIEHAEELVRDFPDARFIIVRRNPAEALESFCAAAPQDGAAIRAGWPDYLTRFEEMVASLPKHSCCHVSFSDLESYERIIDMHEFATGRTLDEGRWRQLRSLRVTADIPALPRPAAQPLTVSVNVEGFDFSRLTVRAYSPDDRAMVAAWFEYHKDTSFPQVRIPPLGLVVEDADGPVAALWCFETYGIGVAWIALPVTRPGLSYRRASTVLAFGIMAITQLAGSGYEPRARFDCFRVICPASMGRLLQRLGFIEQPGRSNYFLSV